MKLLSHKHTQNYQEKYTTTPKTNPKLREKHTNTHEKPISCDDQLTAQLYKRDDF